MFILMEVLMDISLRIRIEGSKLEGQYDIRLAVKLLSYPLPLFSTIFFFSGLKVVIVVHQVGSASGARREGCVV